MPKKTPPEACWRGEESTYKTPPDGMLEEEGEVPTRHLLKHAGRKSKC